MAKVLNREKQSAESPVKCVIGLRTAVVQLRLFVRRNLRHRLCAIWPRLTDCAPATRVALFLTSVVLLAFGGPAALGQSAALTSPAPGSVLPGSSATFTWTALSYVTSYKLKLGSAVNSGDLGIYTAGHATAGSLSVHATGLPTNGSIVYASLTSVIGGYPYTSQYAYFAAFRGSSAAPVIGSLSCTTTSFTGSGADACTVKLNAAAGKSGAIVELAGSTGAAIVPASVKLPPGARTASFQAEISAVLRDQTAILMATDGKSSKTFAIELNAGKSVLELDASRVEFGNVALSSPSTQSLGLTSTGKDALAIDSVKIAGTGFTVSGPKFPMTLDPGKSVTLDLEFDPAAIGTSSGTLTIASNSVTGSLTVVPLSGTGQKIAYEVRLTWDAPSRSDVSIAGYRVFRAIGGSSSYGLLNDSLDLDTSYVDDSVQPGAEYDYYVETIDTAGVSSAPSKTLSIAIP